MTFDTQKIEICIFWLLCFGICSQFFSVAISNVFFGIGIVLFLWWLSKNIDKARDIWDNKERRMYVVLYVLFILSIVPSLFSPEASLHSFKKFCDIAFFRIMPFVIIITLAHNTKLWQKMIGCLLFINCVHSCLAIWQTLSATKYVRSGGLTGGLLYPAMLCFLIPFTVLLILNEDVGKKLKLFAGISLILMIGGMLASGSRGCICIFFIQCLMVFIYCLRNCRKAAIISVIVAVIVGTAIFAHPVLNSRIRSVINLSSNFSNVQRILMWKASWQMLKDYPITGVGLGNWQKMYKKKYINRKKTRKTFGHAHNSYLHMGAETGYLGFFMTIVVHLFIVLKNLLDWIKTNNSYSYMIAMIWLGFGLFGIVEATITFTILVKLLMWLTGILLALKLVKEKGE